MQRFRLRSCLITTIILAAIGGTIGVPSRPALSRKALAAVGAAKPLTIANASGSASLNCP